MWEHIWIAYGEVLFTFAIARGLSSLAWTRSRMLGASRIMLANTLATVGMVAFAMGDAHPASPRGAYVLALAIWAACAVAMGGLLIVEPATRQSRLFSSVRALVEPS